MLFRLLRRGHTYNGIKPLGVYRESLLKFGIDVFESSEKLIKEFRNTKFDLIIHFFVLQHIKELISLLSKRSTYWKLSRVFL